MESDCDHVHLLIDCNPQHSIPNIIKALKGVSARLLFKEFPQAKKEAMGRESLESSIHPKSESEVKSDVRK